MLGTVCGLSVGCHVAQGSWSQKLFSPLSQTCRRREKFMWSKFGKVSGKKHVSDFARESTRLSSCAFGHETQLRGGMEEYSGNNCGSELSVEADLSFSWPSLPLAGTTSRTLTLQDHYSL